MGGMGDNSQGKSGAVKRQQCKCRINDVVR